MSNSAGNIEQCGIEARTGWTGCEGYAGQIKINQSEKIFFRIVYYIVQQPTQLNSHLRFFLSVSIVRCCYSNSLGSILTIEHGQVLAHDLRDCKIHNCFRMISRAGLDGTFSTISSSFSFNA
jgi:hypothetical protein